MNIDNNSIILVNSSNRKRALELIGSNALINRKVMTFNEFKKKLSFECKESVIYEIMKKENVSVELAILFLNNMYYLDKAVNEKSKYLLNIKKYLEDKKIIYTNELFKSSIKHRKIYLFNMPYLTKKDEKIIESFNCEKILLEQYNKPYYVYEADTLENEVIFVADKVSELLKQGISINKIKLMNLNDEYKLYIKRVFRWFNIPTNLDIESNLYSTKLAHIFLKDGIDSINDYVENDNDEKIVNKLIDIYNKFIWCEDIEQNKELIINELKNTKIPNNKFGNAIEQINMDDIILADEYVFLLGFNQSIIPRIYKDEDYFSDIEKENMGIPSTFELNKLEKKKVKYYLSTINNLIISYKKRSLTDIFYPSSLLEELDVKYINYKNNYNNSNLFNKILLSKKLDDYYRFGIKDHSLGLLYNKYQNISYNTYDNSYTKIPEEKIDKYFNEKLLLSFTSIDNYFRCGFRYYLQSVLKLNLYEETFMQQIGNLFHSILSESFKDNFNFDEYWNKYIEKFNIGINNKEVFFLNKLKKEILYTIDVINRQQSKSNLKDFYYEEKIYINPNNDEKVVFMGIIDKLAYKKVNDKYLVAIIDYKTGNPSLNLNYLPYGIDMQLPIYLYLAHHIQQLKPIEIVGFYLQKIIHSEINYDSKLSYDEQKNRNLMLQGYSNNNESLLMEFDSTYTNSEVIKSMKMSSKGFYQYSKVLSTREMDEIYNIVNKKILLAIQEIEKGNFEINPKRVGFNNIGCEFCKYKDICFKKEKDIVNLKEYKNLDFLGGDYNA